MFDALVESRALWKELCETIGDLVFETDRQGRFTFLWPPECLGWLSDELIGRPTSTLLVQPTPGASVFDPFRARRPIRLSQACLLQADGETAVMAISARPTPNGGTRGVAIDITEADAAARAASTCIRVRRTVDRVLLAASHELVPSATLRTALGAALGALGAEGAALFRTLRGEDGGAVVETLQAVGAGWDAMASLDGVTRPLDDDPEPNPLADGDGAPPEAALLLRGGQAVLRAAVGGRLATPTILTVWRGDDGSPWSAEDRLVTGALARALRHVVEVDSLQHELVRSARTDLLTGLLDRAAFLSDVGRRFGRLDHETLDGTMLSVGLDGFRAVNEGRGIEDGDRVLRFLADALRDSVRPTDLVGRIGGDEFAIWLDGADLFAAAERADALCRHTAFLDTEKTGGCRGWSIGLAARPPGTSETPASLLQRATIAMRTAKQNGRNRWCASREEIGT